MAKYECTALLPMKAHSERVPNKNIRNFCGKRLYQHILESLLKSLFITEVVIDTDSEIIAEEAPKLFDRIKIIERPLHLCGDLVSMNAIISYDLEQSNGTHFLQTHSTNPLLPTHTINNAILKYFDNLAAYDSLFSVTRLQTRFYWSDGSPVNHDSSKLIRTQDLPAIYEENSNIYLFSKESFLYANNNRLGKRPLMFETDRLESIDIDEEADFRIAEAIFRTTKNLE